MSLNLNELYAKISRDFWKGEQVAQWVRNNFFTRSKHQQTSSGAASGSLPIITDVDGKIDATFIDDGDIDHGSIGGLGDDDHSQYALLAGRSGGQTLKGDTASGGNLTLMSTSHATKGKILFGNSAYDGANNRLGIGVDDPATQIESSSTSTSATRGVTFGQYNTGAQAYLINVLKARGSRSSPSTVSSGDFGLVFLSKFYDGSGYIASAGFGFKVNGSVSTGVVPVDMIFSAGSGDAQSLQNEIVRLYGNTGNVGIGALSSIGASMLGIKAGTSSNDAAVGGVLYVTVGTSGQVGAGPDTLGSYSVPASTLAVNNQSIWWRAAGVIATSATSGAIVVKFGATTLLTINASPVSGGEWWAEGEIYRTGAATQRAVSHGQCNQGSTTVNAFGDVTPGETLSGAVTLAVTGNSSSAANNDTVLHTLKVGWDDANT